MKLKCPICGKPVDYESASDFPFCGERCRTQDLGNWSAEKYVVSQPGFDEEEFDEASSEGSAQQRKRGEQSDGHGQDEV